MKLPTISQPLFEETIPSNDKKILFRPYTVAEEKILLIAKESDSEADIVRAMRQVLNLCVQDSFFATEKLTTFDLEYLFLKLRAKSVENIVKLSYRDNDDDKIYTFELNLDDVKVVFPDNQLKSIKVNDVVSFTMRYPDSDISNRLKDFDNEVDLMLFFVSNCIDIIYEGDTPYDTADFDIKEVSQFVESLDLKTFEKVKEFFESIPKLYHKFEYVNEHGDDRKVELTQLKDFFTLV